MAKPGAGRRTRIVATIGPASRDQPVLHRVLAAGVDVVRLNFSHGTRAEHGETIRRVRAEEARLGWPVCILQDLGGPKIRLGPIESGSMQVARGGEVILDPACRVGGGRVVGLTFAGLGAVVKPGTRLLLDDGRVELRVIRVEGERVVCRAVRGEVLREHKGLNLPGVRLPLPSLTEKDLADLAFGVKAGVDVVALSFVRRADDLVEARRHLAALGGDQLLIAKLERAEAVRNLDAILRVADGVMVARGDMAVELSPEDVPVVQKHVIARATAAGKPVITATQMLESMVDSPRPTRAEASDVANAILDGTDAVMLSEETASGNYPVEAVATMHRIALRIERARVQRVTLPALDEVGEVPRAVARVARDLADSLGAARLVVFTHTGGSARYVSKCRPVTPILAVTPNLPVARRLQLLYGVRTILVKDARTLPRTFARLEAAVIATRHGRPGELVVLVYGLPMGTKGTTNTVRVHTLGTLDGTGKA
ncbi:MAG: pyruvate kinase [Candidatus Dormibacteria bacterium]